MPKLSKSLPKYRKHRASGQAVVTVGGRDFYLGPHGTKASRIEYDRVLCQWLEAGRQPILEDHQVEGITVLEIVDRFWTHAKRYYVRNGKPTGQLGIVKASLRPLKELYGKTPAADFGPTALKTIRRHMMEGRIQPPTPSKPAQPLCRREINRRVQIIKQVFRWAVAEEFIPPAVHQALAAVDGLKKGRTEAVDHAPVEPVPDAVVDATLPYMPAIVADMVRLQRLTGCRPGEICDLRPCDLDRSDDIWLYRPTHHKAEHHGKSRLIFFGPKAQQILTPYLLRPADAHCFSPDESERRRRAELHLERKTPMSCGNRPGSARKANPKRKPRNFYTVMTYARSIRRAIERANELRTKEAAELGQEPALLPHWTPNQLRHTAATEIRRQFGIEGAQVALGHSKASTTEIYAEKNADLGREIARKIG